MYIDIINTIKEICKKQNIINILNLNMKKYEMTF